MPTAPMMDVVIPVERAVLRGMLAVPEGAQGIVAFAHGSGSSRLSPRNQQVAEGLAEGGFATLLFDLLTEEESRDRGNVFDIPMLGRRLAAVVDRMADDPQVGELPIGLFGASTGAAAALDAAAARPQRVAAVVSRGGRPDLSEGRSQVQAPVLLIVGAEDTAVIGMNERAAESLGVEHDLRLVAGAGHLFEGPGQLEEVTDLARAWFDRHLASG